MHFYTISATERDASAPGGYRDEGIACYVYDSQVAGTIPLYRLYRQPNAAHFYTTSADERDHAIANDGYNSEGIACYVFGGPGQQTVPLWRLFNSQSGEHFYTTNEDEVANAVAHDGFQVEFRACYVYDSQVAGTTPFYRLYLVPGIGELKSMGLTNVQYDLDHALMDTPQVDDANTQDITNTSSAEQTTTYTFEIDYAETKKWSATFEIKVGTQVEATIDTGIPYISNAKVQVSTEMSFSYTWGSEDTVTKKYTDAIPVKVPPHSHIIAKASVSRAKVSVPYTADAIYHFSSGQDISGNITGVFEGVMASLLQVSFTEPQPMPQ